MRQLPMLLLLGIASWALAPEVAEAPAGPNPTERAACIEAEDACSVAADLLDSLRDDFAAHLDRRDREFLSTPLLRKREKRAMRQSRNDDHVACARRLGIPRDSPAAHPDGAAGLACLDQQSPYYVDHEVGMPRLTPDALASLDLVGERFHAKLQEAGLPPVRMAVSSAYRSAEYQARLRRLNRNATRTVSSHEFGTTYDLTYRRFFGMGPGVVDSGAYIPPPSLREAYACMREDLIEAERAWAVQMTERWASRFAAVLGRVLIELEDERKVLALREWRQPCYHITVAQELDKA